MKDKILETEIRQHAEAISKALRKYSSEPLYCHLTIFTRDNDESECPDYCDINVHTVDEATEEFVFIVSQAYLIHHNDEGEITKTTPFPNKGVKKNDSQD